MENTETERQYKETSGKIARKYKFKVLYHDACTSTLFASTCKSPPNIAILNSIEITKHPSKGQKQINTN